AARHYGLRLVRSQHCQLQCGLWEHRRRDRAAHLDVSARAYRPIRLRIQRRRRAPGARIIMKPISRRAFTASLAASSLLHAAPTANYKVGITTNTRGGWENDVYLSFREAREAGYHWVESFVSYFMDYLERPQALKEKTDEIGVKFVTISNN